MAVADPEGPMLSENGTIPAEWVGTERRLRERRMHVRMGLEIALTNMRREERRGS